MHVYSVEVPFTETPSSSPIRRSYREELIGHNAVHGCKTLFETFQRACILFKDNSCLGYRYKDSCDRICPFAFLSYQEVSFQVSCIASGILKEDILPKPIAKISALIPESLAAAKCPNSCTKTRIAIVIIKYIK